jgi:hypothetical protein
LNETPETTKTMNHKVDLNKCLLLDHQTGSYITPEQWTRKYPPLNRWEDDPGFLWSVKTMPPVVELCTTALLVVWMVGSWIFLVLKLFGTL